MFRNVASNAFKNLSGVSKNTRSRNFSTFVQTSKNSRNLLFAGASAAALGLFSFYNYKN